MKFINSTVEPIVQQPGMDGMLKHIELCGRVSYKSEDKITDDSAEKFVQMIIDRGHTSVLEHGTVYLTIPADKAEQEQDLIGLFNRNPYSCVRLGLDDNWYITTNYRVIKQSCAEWAMKDYMTEPKPEHELRHTFRFVCSRGVSHELVRHRVMSVTQESTRYCNYSKDKHGNELTFIIPEGVTDISNGEKFGPDDISTENVVKLTLEGKYSSKSLMLICAAVSCENIYMQMATIGCTPQECRDVLTHGIKTEVIMTGTIAEWNHFLSLRSKKNGAKGAHPDMVRVADMVYDHLVAEYSAMKSDK